MMVKIINNNNEEKTYNGFKIGAGATLELPKADAKAFIRKFQGVDWIRATSPTEDKKKEVVETAPEPVEGETPQVEIVGERGEI